MRLDITGARRLHLAAQGLLSPPGKSATRADVLRSIRGMGALQIDSISVLARSPYFVLWSRLGAYDPAWLDQLLERGSIFEYWSHAACFLPIEDYPLYRPFREFHWPQWRRWLEKNQDVAAETLAFVRERGEAKSSDFKHAGPKREGWWDWKPEKLALECLFRMGEVMTLRRDSGFQRVYALPERVLRDKAFPEVSREEAVRRLVVKSVRCMGAARGSWVADYFRLRRENVKAALQEAVEAGELFTVEVEGWIDPWYVHSENRRLAVSAARGSLRAERTTFLTPFDPVVWHRPRAKELFDFTYQIEVYTPVERRQYGYFNLPILHHDRLVGRLDAKAHRREGRFEVRSLHFEENVDVDEEMSGAIGLALHDCATWHGTPEVAITAEAPMVESIRQALP